MLTQHSASQPLYVITLSFLQSQITVLMVASYNGKIEVMKELLAAGALTDIQDNVCRVLYGIVLKCSNLTLSQLVF